MSKHSFTLIISGIILLLLTGCYPKSRNFVKPTIDPLEIANDTGRINKEYEQLPKFEDFDFKSMNLPLPNEFVKVDKPAEMIDEAIPSYPLAYKLNNIMGYVWVNTLIGTDGTVICSRVKKSSGHELFEKTAIIAAYKCKFKPAEYKSVPVAVWVVYSVESSLRNR